MLSILLSKEVKQKGIRQNKQNNTKNYLMS